MFDIKIFDNMELKEKYDLMILSLKGLTSSDDGVVAKLGNASALINAVVGELNWCGFYLDNGKELELGPFQGLPACTKIAYEKGVCGAAYTKGEAIVVDNVNEFPGHIACDAATNSELVIPIIKDGKKIGVLDMDSEKVARFSQIEVDYLQEAVKIIEQNIF